MPTPATSAQSYCTEAARAAALASHSAASLAAAAGFREAARLLRSSEALARAATAALLAIPRREGGVPDAGDGIGEVISAKKKRPKKKKGKQNEKEVVLFGPELPPPADGVLEVGMVASTSALSPAAAEFVPGKARVLVARTSRERSPHRTPATSSSSPSASSRQMSVSVPTGSAVFVVGQAVVLDGLVSRVDLQGKCGVIKSFDGVSKRYAVCIDVTNEVVRVLEKNLRPSIFVSSQK